MCLMSRFEKNVSTWISLNVTETRRFTYIILFLTYLHVIADAQRAEKDVSICTPIVNSRARLVHIHSPDTPNLTSGSQQCTCNVTSSRDQPLYASTSLYISTSVDSLQVNYERGGDVLLWTVDNLNISARHKQCGGFQVIDTTAFVHIVYKEVNLSNTVFSIEVGTINKSDELRITCTQLPIDEDVDKKTDEKTGVLQYIESYCSSYILIGLGSVCAALLVIILVLAIMLCCTVRKSTSYKTRQSSNASQPLSTQSSLGLPMESYRVASRIYDDGTAMRGSENGDQYPVPRHHSLPTVRQSAAYANTLDMNIYGNT